MKQVVIYIISFLLSVSSVFSQNKGTYEFQRYNSSRTAKLNTGKEITVTFQPKITEGSSVIISESVVGILNSVTDSKLNMLVATEYAQHTYSQDSILETYRKHSYDYSLSYDTQTIAYITYAPKIRPAIEMATFASLISLAVIAPLYAFNIKEQNFNSDAYMSIAAPAAVATLITVPLYFKIEERKVRILLK